MKYFGIIIVDLQGDFTTLKTGSLAVEGTDTEYLSAVEKTARGLKEKGFKLFATQDWHPKDHISFFTNTPGRKAFDTISIDGRDQILWPPHCVQDSENAGLLLDPALFTAIVRKGTDSRYDSYSGFQDDGGARTDLDNILKTHGIKTLIVFGLATDFCVRFTVLDALKSGYKVMVLQNLCRGVAPDSTEQALREMKDKGALLLETDDIDTLEARLLQI